MPRSKGATMKHQGAIVVGLGHVHAGRPELDWAAREATSRGRPLHVVRAFHPSQATMPWENRTDRLITISLRRDAEARVEAALSHLKTHWPDLAVEPFVVSGIPWDALCTASAEADLTVLGSRGLRTVGSTMLGSVSTVVAARASGAVVVVAGPSADVREQAKVVVGVDGSELTDEVLAFAMDHAARHRRRVHAVYCWSPDLLAEMSWRQAVPAPERAERWLAEAVAGWREKYPDVALQIGVVRGFPASALVEHSAAQELLVVGSRSRHARVAALLGSVAQGVLHHATCPVAVIHAPSEP
jgi:nucleotide-binding universal stress UspA family protein